MLLILEAHAELNPCQLVDGASATKLLGRPFKGTPRPLTLQRRDGQETSCSYSAEGSPVTILTVAVLEFNSIALAQAWAGQASKPGSAGQLKHTQEPALGDDGVCWSERTKTGCLGRKGRMVVEIQIRASSTTTDFRVTPGTMKTLREVVMNSVKRL